MDHLAVNWLAIVLATVASMALGVVWYMGLSRQWLAALGKTRDELNSSDPSPYIWSVVVQFVMAYFVALLTTKLFGSTDVANGIQTVQLELAQLTYMDEDTFAYLPERAARTQGLIRRLLERTLA